MKKTISIFAILLILFISVISTSCINGGGCSRSDLRNNKYYATSIIGKTFDGKTKNFDIKDTTVLRYDDLRISLDFSGKFYSKVNPQFEIFPSAYACSPAEPSSEERVTNISIIANQDFDSLHLAGSNLKELFYISRRYNSSTFSIEEYLKTNPKVEELEFKLAAAPDIQKEIQFTVIFQYNGKLVKELRYTTPAFILSTY